MSKIHDLEVDAYLKKCVSIEPLALNEEYVQFSSDLAYWNAYHAEALRTHLIASLNVDRVVAMRRIELRAKMAETQKVTESMIDAAVDMDIAVCTARFEAIEAEVEKVRLRGVVDALHAKKDMLVSLGATIRMEMEGEPSLRAAMRDSKEIRK